MGQGLGAETAAAQADQEPAWFTAAIADAPHREWIEVEGAAIELLTWGRRGAPGLLFTHGARAHADWWSHLLPMFAAEHRVACLSWSGMGRSGWRDRYTLPQYVREAFAASEAAGLFEAETKPIIIGHSFGAYMAAIAAADHGERLRGAVIVDSTIRPERSQWPEIGAPQTYASFAEARRRFRFAPAQACEPYIGDWLARHALMEADGVWSWRFDPEIYGKLQFDNIWEMLARPRCPIAFVRGGASAVVTDELAAKQSAQAPKGTPYISVAGAGHHLMADKPLELVAALKALIADWPEGAWR